MTKKGLMAFGTVFVLSGIIAIIVISQFVPYKTEFTIGQKQRAALQAYAEGEFIKDYLNRAAELSLESALSELGQTGGYPDLAPCGSMGGYNVWTNCIPNQESFRETFRDLFNANFANYLLARPVEREIPAELFSLDDVLSYEYDGANGFKVETSPVSATGFPKKELVGVPVVNESGDVNFEPVETDSAIEIHNLKNDITYTTSSYFHSEPGINLDKLHKELTSVAASLDTSCIADKSCGLNSPSFSYNIKYSEGAALVTATYPYKVPIYRETSIERSNLEFKFALV